MARYDGILKSLGTKLNVVIHIAFLSKMGDKVKLNAKLNLSLILLFNQTWGIKCDNN